jgi:hypothetical protein
MRRRSPRTNRRFLGFVLFAAGIQHSCELLSEQRGGLRLLGSDLRVAKRVREQSAGATAFFVCFFSVLKHIFESPSQEGSVWWIV